MKRKIIKIGRIERFLIKTSPKNGQKYYSLKINLENKKNNYVGYRPIFTEFIKNNFNRGDFIKIIGHNNPSACGKYPNFKLETFHRLIHNELVIPTWDNLSSTQRWLPCVLENSFKKDK